MVVFIKGLCVYLTLKIMVWHQFIYLRFQLTKVSRQVPLLGHASIPEP